jgi:hypothetical protein
LLQHTDIAERGTRALAEALQQNGSLTVLDLQARLFHATDVKRMSWLTLMMQKCDVGNGGARALAEALKKNGRLEALWLRVCRKLLHGYEGTLTSSV